MVSPASLEGTHTPEEPNDTLRPLGEFALLHRMLRFDARFAGGVTPRTAGSDETLAGRVHCLLGTIMPASEVYPQVRMVGAVCPCPWPWSESAR